MTLKSFDWSIPPIKLEIGCLLSTMPNRSGGAWHSTLRIAFTHLCLTAGPTEELNILYNAENIPHVYDEANSVSSHKTTSRSSLPVVLASSVLAEVVEVSLPPGQRWICLEVPVSSFVYRGSKTRDLYISFAPMQVSFCPFDWPYSGIRISEIAVRFLFLGKFGKTYLQTFGETRQFKKDFVLQ